MTNQNVPVSEYVCLSKTSIQCAIACAVVEWWSYHELGHSWCREPEDICGKVDLWSNGGQLGQVALTYVLELGVPVAIHLLRRMVRPVESKRIISDVCIDSRPL